MQKPRGVRVPMRAILDQFFSLRLSVRDSKTKAHYERSVRWLGEMLGRPPTVADFHDDNVTALLKWLTTERRQSAVTANGSHKCLCSLWRWARDRGIVARGPTVSRLPEPEPDPDSFSDSELDALLKTAVEIPGSYRGVPAGDWWRAYFAIELATVERSGALLKLQWEWIDWHAAVLRIPPDARKGKLRGEAHRLPRWAIDCLRTLAELQGQPNNPRGSILECKTATYYRRWDALLLRAGIRAGRRQKGQKVRRTLATLAVIAGKDPQLVLRHKTPGLAWRRYVDRGRTVEPVDQWAPPRLGQTIAARDFPEPLGIS